MSNLINPSSSSPSHRDSPSTNEKGSGGAADMPRRMVCGGLAGMIAKTATNPLDRIRMLSQTGEYGVIISSPGSKGGGVVSPFHLYRSIIQNEGILGLWAGNGANLLRVFPSKSIVFSGNDLYGKWLGNLHHTWYSEDGTNVVTKRSTLPWSLSFLAGGMAGMTASAATYPLDLARGRITGKLASPSGKKHYKGIINTVVITAREEGAMAVYKGITPTLLGAMPYEGIKFGTVGLLERAFPRTKEGAAGVEGGKDVANSVTRKVAFGGAGGMMAGVLTYPNDTVRRLLQLQGSRGTTEQFSGYWDCVRKTYAKFGIERFYRGVFINIVRMAPNTAIQFGSYELLKQFTADCF